MRLFQSIRDLAWRLRLWWFGGCIDCAGGMHALHDRAGLYYCCQRPV